MDIKNESKEIISWKAPEYEYNPKDVSWYWITLIISIILIAISLWQKNFLFVIFIIIAELIIFYFGNRSPKIWEFKIDDKGIFIGDRKHHEFEKIESFDIHDYNDDFDELILKFNHKLSSYVKIFIHKEDKTIIKNRLSEKIPQEDLEQSLIDSLEKLIKF